MYRHGSERAHGAAWNRIEWVAVLWLEELELSAELSHGDEPRDDRDVNACNDDEP